MMGIPELLVIQIVVMDQAWSILVSLCPTGESQPMLPSRSHLNGTIKAVWIAFSVPNHDFFGLPRSEAISVSISISES